MALLRSWFAQAVAHGVREPGATALATVAADGIPSSRMMQVSRITDRGLLFATHSISRKGREIDETGRWSGVLYWRETNQQVTLGGVAELADAAVADELWSSRPMSSNAMSIATRQSSPLTHEHELLQEALLLTAIDTPLVRPADLGRLRARGVRSGVLAEQPGRAVPAAVLPPERAGLDRRAAPAVTGGPGATLLAGSVTKRPPHT